MYTTISHIILLLCFISIFISTNAQDSCQDAGLVLQSACELLPPNTNRPCGCTCINDDDNDECDDTSSDSRCIDADCTTTTSPDTTLTSIDTTLTSIDTTLTSIDTTSPITTSQTTIECPECPFNITLTSIGNITINSCPIEEDCICENGLISFTTTYINDNINANTITFYYSGNTVACPMAQNIEYEHDIVCTIDTTNIDATRFGITTRFIIEYTNGNICEGTFDTSCTSNILGEFGNGCTDLVITSWTDRLGTVCTGDVSLTRPPTTAPITSLIEPQSESSESENSAVQRHWKYKSGSDDSSNSGSRRRYLMSNSDSSVSDRSVITDSWYTNKKCIPNCIQWGKQRGIECGCYESCTNNALNDNECYTANIFGYCGTGVCCCGGQCISTKCDSYGSDSSDSNNRRRSLLGSDRCVASSDSNDGYYSYAEWFKDKCGLTNNYKHMYYSQSSSRSSDSSRNRRILGASFGSMRHLNSDSSSSYGSRYSIRSDNDYYNDFLIETCVMYEINIGLIDDNCIENDIFIFLPLCENNFTDFNSSNLNASDITNIITDITFEDDNILQAEGCEFKGELGVCIVLNDFINTNTFEICFGNVTVSAENIDTFNITTIDTSNGIVIYNTSNGQNTCPIDGLPCFNFFFDADCPPITTIDNTYRSCECDDNEMVQINLQYIGIENVDITFRRNYRRGMLRGGTYNDGNVYSVSQDDIIEVISDPYDKFKKYTGVQITDVNSNVICIGVIRRCSIDIIGGSVDGCDDLIVMSWIDSDGALCDEIAVNMGSSSNENALINDGRYIDNGFKIFNDLDPYIKYSLISILIMFCILICIGGYICIKNDYSETIENKNIKNNNDKKNIENDNDNNKKIENNNDKNIENTVENEKKMHEMHVISLKTNENDKKEDSNEGNINDNDIVYEDEYYNDENAYNIAVEMVNTNNTNDEYLD